MLRKLAYATGKPPFLEKTEIIHNFAFLVNALQQQADLGEQGRAPIGCSAATAAAYRRAASDVSANEGARALAHHVPPK